MSSENKPTLAQLKRQGLRRYELMAAAFKAGVTGYLGNKTRGTLLEVEGGKQVMCLIHHNTTIARYYVGYYEETLTYYTGGFSSMSTCARLNAIEPYKARINIKDGGVQFNGEYWDGSKRKVFTELDVSKVPADVRYKFLPQNSTVQTLLDVCLRAQGLLPDDVESDLHTALTAFEGYSVSTLWSTDDVKVFAESNRGMDAADITEEQAVEVLEECTYNGGRMSDYTWEAQFGVAFDSTVEG